MFWTRKLRAENEALRRQLRSALVALGSAERDARTYLRALDEAVEDSREQAQIEEDAATCRAQAIRQLEAERRLVVLRTGRSA